MKKFRLLARRHPYLALIEMGIVMPIVLVGSVAIFVALTTFPLALLKGWI